MQSDNKRPEFYQRIDDALGRRHKLASAIEAMAKESNPNSIPMEISELLVALRGSPVAEEFIQDDVKAAWLPLILRGVSADGSTSDNREDLEQIVNELSFAMEARRSQWRFIAYPLAILACSILLFVLLSLTVIPTFQNMFREFELTLPPATRLLMTISDVIRFRPLTLCLSLAGIALVVFMWIKLFPRLLQLLETSWLLGFFLSGGIGSVKAMGRFTSTLAELLNIGAPLDQAITIAGRSSQNLRFRIASERLAKDIGLSGRFCYKSTAAHSFPALVSHALEAGPNGGPSIALLRQVSLNYFDRVTVRFNWSVGLSAPLMLICVGLGVGFIVLSLFIPLTSLITSLSG